VTGPPVRRRSKFADRLLEYPEFVFSEGREFAQRGQWRDFFARRRKDPFAGPLIFEIGCNDAALLANVAARHPDAGFVGIDWKCRALHTAAARIAEAGLRNVSLLNGRAQDIARIFASGELDEIWLFHPDPCDGPRERGNRLFSASFLIDAAETLHHRSSLLILKTDHREYYQSSVQMAETAAQFAVTAHSEDYWADELILAHTACRSFFGEVTSFENRFRRKRKPIYYLELSRR
jgi:tRNA (guanine-N7-)-methyltransferase